MRYGRKGREHWLDLARKAGFWSEAQSGTLCVARHDDELAMVNEFAAERGDREVVVLDRAEIDRSSRSVRTASSRSDVERPAGRPADGCTVDRTLARPSGVDFHHAIHRNTFRLGCCAHDQGDVRGATIFVTVNYDIDRLFPEFADRDNLQRCRPDTPLRVPRSNSRPDSATSGWSLVRYSGPRICHPKRLCANGCVPSTPTTTISICTRCTHVATRRLDPRR